MNRVPLKSFGVLPTMTVHLLPEIHNMSTGGLPRREHLCYLFMLRGIPRPITTVVSRARL